MKFSRELLLVALVIVCHGMNGFAEDDDRWWPVQKLPAGVMQTRERGLSAAEQMLAQSVAGLTAKSVNQSTGDEMVWVSINHDDIETWFKLWLKRNATVQSRGELGLWELVDRYAQRGIIKGYILYSPDSSEGQLNDHRKSLNNSVNVATSLAGILDGVLIDESLEPEAKKHGLTRLMDSRDKSLKWCFETYRDRFNRRMLCTQDPKKPHVRDLAIAQQAFSMFGNDEPLEAALKWLEPLSPILGWNGGDEFETTRLSTIYGHIQTATDWCTNLPVLMAGAEKQSTTQSKPTFDPAKIDFQNRKNSVSFVITDGDNVQWLETSFVHAQSYYWDNPDRGKIPFGWSCCYAQLAQLCPSIIEYLNETRKSNDAMIEWGGGYYYPDLFGKARPNPEELLARHARRTWKLMQKTGTRVIGFNVAKVSSPEAQKAYETFARETDDLASILVFQYAPYEGGAGAVFWAKDHRGIEIPVISARYSLWEHTNSRPRSGTPAKVAREILDVAANKENRNDWVVVHAWSYFRRAPGSDESAEDMSQENAHLAGGLRGYFPALWCAERLGQGINVVTPEELSWRVRMNHDPKTTSQLLKR